MNILLACERSAGHVFPALSIASALAGNIPRKEEPEAPARYLFITAPDFNKYLEDKTIRIVGRPFLFRNILLEGVWRFFEALYLIIKLKPGKVIGFGGRDSFFIVLLSCLFRIETVIYEPNISFGKANRVLSRFVRQTWRGLGDIPGSSKERSIGIPLRKNIVRVDASQACQRLGLGQAPVILCFGGSQGSAFINKIFLEFIRQAKQDGLPLRVPFEVIHLTGPLEYFQIQQFYTTIGIKAFVRDFYYDMQFVYSAAHLAICRAGANTLAELSFFGLPAVIVPHPAAGGHQRDNALYFKAQGAALLFEQRAFRFEDFSKTLDGLIADPSKLNAMRGSMEQIKGGIPFEDFCRTFHRI